MAKKVETFEVEPIKVKRATIVICGDSDLILNKMNDVTSKALMDKQKNKSKSTVKPNEWEGIITSVHWLHKLPDTNRDDWDEETMKELLKTNTPCISAFGLNKSIKDAYVRATGEKEGTRIMFNINIPGVRGENSGDGNLVPIKFCEWTVNERLIPASGKAGGVPVLARFNTFSGWSAEVEIKFTDSMYSLEQITSMFNLAGFGIGIGSGRSSGYGRYHVQEVRGE